MCDKPIRINFYSDLNEYCVYIPYRIINTEHDYCISNTYLISKFFGLPTERNEGEPTYTYTYDIDTFEIGFIHKKLDDVYTIINKIKQAIIEQGGHVSTSQYELLKEGNKFFE